MKEELHTNEGQVSQLTVRERFPPQAALVSDVKNNRAAMVCEVCSTSCSPRVYSQRHGENCTEFTKINKNRGTIEGFTNYYINMKTGVLYKNTGKMMSANINARGNRVVNLTRDDGKRIKVNIDREWMKLHNPGMTTDDVRAQVLLLTAENSRLKVCISSPIQLILTAYFEDLHPETMERSVLGWTNYIMMNNPELNRELVREVLITLKTGVARVTPYGND